MITVIKGHEPKEWTDLNKTPGLTVYEAIPELRAALLRDQGYICAYCMRVIPVAKKDPDQAETSKIEHILSREHHKNEQRSYKNMVICCPGYIDATDHCDKSKKSDPIHFSPFDPSVQASISYITSSGEIKSDNAVWSTDINEVICLNNSMLKLNRLQALNGVKDVLLRKKYALKLLKEKLEEWKRPNAEGKRKAYCGIVIWYLEKKIRASS